MKKLYFGLITLAMAGLFIACQSTKWSQELPAQGVAFVCESNRLTNLSSPSALPLEESTEQTAWKGESLNLQFLAYSFTLDQIQFNLVAKNDLAKAILPSASLYQLGWVKGDTKKELYADSMLPISLNQTIALKEKEILPMWIQFQLPTQIETGTAQFYLNATTQTGKMEFSLPINIKILDLVLPPVADSTYHLDFWQNPYSFAAQHGVELWSEEHFAVMKPYMEKLATMGQRAVTVSMIDKPWNGQTHDDFGAMIDWRKKADGSFTYDYSIFDTWVQFAFDCGVDEAIHCYSMIPWHNKFGYTDEASGEFISLMAIPGSSTFEAHWAPFLTDFQRHLEEKGWIEKAAISMDERPEATMKKLLAFVKKAAPKLKITSACNYQAEVTNEIDNISVQLDYTTNIPEQWIQNRKNNGQITTYYVCTVPRFPNSFIYSDPAEAQWLGWYAAAKDYDGVLRWAYNSWPEDPMNESAFGLWPAGDTYLIFPGDEENAFISSVRLEKWHDGTEDWLKIQKTREWIQERANADDFNAKLDALLEKFEYDSKSNGHNEAKLVKSVEREFNELVDKAFTLF